MSLSYFTIFNPSLGPDEETLANQLLFYTSSIVSDLDSQLRNIGLVQGIIELGKSFAQKDTPPIDFIKSKDTRSYLQELEPGYWSILCLDVVSEEGLRNQELPTALQVNLQVKNAYQSFVLEHGTFDNVLSQGRSTAIKTIEQWWMKWSWSWTIACADAILLCNGCTQSRSRLTNAQSEEIRLYRDRLSELFPECFHEMLVMDSDEYLASGTILSLRNKRGLQQYIITHPYRSTDVPTSQTDDAAVNPSVSGQDSVNHDNGRDESWLTGKKWSRETTKVINIFSFTRDRNVEAENVPTESEDTYIWQFVDERQITLLDDEYKTKYLNVLRFRNLAFIILFNVPAVRERTLVKEHIDSSISHLATSLSQLVPPAQKAPLFFSIVHDSKTGSTTSTLPSLAAALVPLASDTPLQASVKANTIHLHRQIYHMWSSGGSCIKTSRAIWIMKKEDEWGTIILAKSGKSGESLEEIEKLGQLFIQKLQRNHITT